MFKKYGIYVGVVIVLFSCKTKEKKSEAPLAEVVAKQEKPNIILIMSDDQGYGDIGLHGNKNIQTPNIDKLGRESVRFTDFHVGTTCAPTRSGLMSGMNCNRVGAWHTINGRSLLSNRFETVATGLKKTGYETGIFGKWHLGDNYPYRPQDRGFTESLVHGGGGVGQTPDIWNNDYYDDTYLRNGIPEKFEGYCTDIWFNESIKFINKSAKSNKPFFCYISTNAPHSPFHVPQKYIDMYKDNKEVVNPNFYGMITNFDENLGKLDAYLKGEGLDKNTIVIFLTDNGSAGGARIDKNGFVRKGYNAKMRGMKVWHYEGGHRVPLYIKYPNSKGIEPQVHSLLTTYTDLVPTILEMGGVDISNKKYDGVSLVPVVTTGQQKNLKGRTVIVDTQREEALIKWKQACIMQDSWRLIGKDELYDIGKDPSQRENIIDQFPEKAKELTAAYEVWWEDIIKDGSIDNLITVGNLNDSPTLLTAHDWHGDNGAPWNQKLIRNLKLGNGYWLLNIEEKGDYKIKLYRWPPNLNKKFSEDLPIGDEVSGGKPYSIGKGIDFKSAKIKINDVELVSEKSVNNTYFEFTSSLEKGRAQFQSWLTDKDKKTLGAYYVILEKI